MKTRRSFLALALSLLIVVLLIIAYSLFQHQQLLKPFADLHKSADLTKLQIKMFEAGSIAPDMSYSIGQKTAQQLYKAALASPRPAVFNRTCLAFAAASYQLVFWAGTQNAEIITADHSGCGDLFLRGGDLRQGSQNFWSFLDQAIDSAPHVKQPDHVEIVRYQGGIQTPLYVKITSARQTQRLFTALSAVIALPQSTTGRCEDQAAAYDDLFFYEGEILQRAQLFRGNCSQVRISGKMAYPALRPGELFQQQMTQELAGVTFAPVKPDTLQIEHAPARIQGGSGPDFRFFSKQDVVQKLYHTTSNLPAWPSNQDSSCNSQGTAESYDVLTFSQGGAWLTASSAFSDCPAISFNRAGVMGGYVSKATQEFWDLVHQAEKG